MNALPIFRLTLPSDPLGIISLTKAYPVDLSRWSGLFAPRVD
jgi:hypothetical protein